MSRDHQDDTYGPVLAKAQYAGDLSMVADAADVEVEHETGLALPILGGLIVELRADDAPNRHDGHDGRASVTECRRRALGAGTRCKGVIYEQYALALELAQGDIPVVVSDIVLQSLAAAAKQRLILIA